MRNPPLALTAICVGLHTSTAADVYASSSRGSDANRGNAASSLATLPEALPPASTALVRAGV
jgi:hypothetical protein